MRLQLALGLALAAGAVTLGSVGILTWRMVEQGQATTDGVPPGMRSPVQAEVGQAAADAVLQWVLPDLDGRPQTIAQWRGKVLVVNFWASWCSPCIEEMPVFSRLHERYASQGVQFVGIGVDDTEKMQSFVQARPVSYPLLATTPEISATPALQMNGLPLTLVIDRAGRLEMSRLGRLDEARLEPVLQRLLAR